MGVHPEARRRQLYGLLGDLPDRSRPISAAKIGEEEGDSYVVERLILDLNGTEPVPAYFVHPRKTGYPLPAILYNHAHGGDYVLGKDELLAGRSALHTPPYAEALTRRGYSALCIDAWAFGERRGRSESEVFKQMLWMGRAQINALIAPRPHLSLAGNFDRLTPPAGLDRIDAELRGVYQAAGAPDAWRLVRYDAGHFEGAAMRAEVLAFLERWL